jgi:hypothetical protein
MSRCALCTTEVPAGQGLCPHHDAQEMGWAASNRIMCDLLHRGLVPPRVRPSEREDEFRGCLQAA